MNARAGASALRPSASATITAYRVARSTSVATADIRVPNTRSPLPMSSHLPGVGFSGMFPDGDRVADLAAAIRTALAPRPADRTIAAQAVKHVGVECLPRGHIDITVERFVRDPHDGITGMLPPQPLRDLLRRPIVIKLGRDQPRQLGMPASLLSFGRRALSNAAASAANARYA